MGQDKLPEPWQISLQIKSILPAEGETQITQQ